MNLNFSPKDAVRVNDRQLKVIAESVPFKPNIAALARKLDLSRDSVCKQYLFKS